MKKPTLFSELKVGDLIQIPIAASREFQRDKIRVPEGAKPTFTYGYISGKMFKAQENDQPKIEVLEILPRHFAERGDAPHVPVIPAEAGSGFTINPNKQWSLVIRPIPINPQSQTLAGEKITHVGTLAGTVTESKLLDKIKNMRDPHLEGAPRFGTPSVGPWDGYIPVGITRWNQEDDFEVKGPKRQYRRKHDFAAKVVDIDIYDAVKAAALPEDIADMLTRSRGRGKRHITSLRKAFELAKNPENLKDFIPEEKELGENPALKDLIDTEVTMAIANGLAMPKKGMDAPPIVTLKEAYTLVTAPDAQERMAKYMFMGPVMRQIAMEEIPAAYEKRTVAAEKDPTQIAKIIKDAYADLMTNGVSVYHATKTVPERFRKEDGGPMWKMV